MNKYYVIYMDTSSKFLSYLGPYKKRWYANKKSKWMASHKNTIAFPIAVSSYGYLVIPKRLMGA